MNLIVKCYQVSTTFRKLVASSLWVFAASVWKSERVVLRWSSTVCFLGHRSIGAAGIEK